MKTNDQITDTRSNKTSVTSETDVSKIISVLGDKINTSDLLSAIMELAVKPVENSGDEQMNKLAFIKNCFNGTTPEIKKFYGDKDLYFCFIPAKMRKEGLPRRIVGKTEEVVIDKLFAALKGQDIKGKSKVVTLTTLYKEWIEERKNDPDIAVQTVRKNICDWNTFYKDKEIANIPIECITPQDLMTHFKSITGGRAITRKAFNNLKAVCNHLFDLAYERNLISTNISRILTTKTLKFKPERRKQDLVYTKEERDKIVEYLKDSDNIYDKAVIIQFCLSCRVSEVKALHWSDIDFDHKRVYIHREVVDGKDESGKDIQILKEQTKSGLSEGNRVLPLSARAENVFNTFIRPENKETMIFLRDGKPLRTESVNTHLRDACRALGIEYLSSHKIRAWGITEALASGMDQATVMRIAGHSTPATMRNYVRIARINKDISDSFNDVFN